MMELDIRDLVPAFILRDPNGYALAQAVETCMRMTSQIIGEGLDAVRDVDKMPEWRLDEMAWEYNNVPYDYAADSESKRRLVQEFPLVYKTFGTPGAVERMVRQYFGNATLCEWWEYEGEYPQKPYHFYVRTTNVEKGSQYTDTLVDMVDQVKNVRSVFDGVLIEFSANDADMYMAAVPQNVEIISTRTEEWPWPF